jgi:hypothetical protein
MVRTSATQVMVIGGIRENTPANFSRTLIYETASQTWFNGPNLTFSRYYHSCGNIIMSEGSSGYSVVVVGGVSVTGGCKTIQKIYLEHFGTLFAHFAQIFK